MLRLVRITQMTIRLCGLLLIILGVLIWAGDSNLVPAHAAIGLLFVIALWILAIIGFYALRGLPQSGRTPASTMEWWTKGSALSFRAAVWAVLVLAFGMLQTRMWPGPLHVFVRLVHLLIGIIAIGIGEVLASRIKKAAGAEAPERVAD